MSEQKTCLDFSDLPEVVWVRILQYLPLKDRARVGFTCRALNRAFTNPVLWSTLTLIFDCRYPSIALSDSYNDWAAYHSIQIINRFGVYTKNFTIKVRGQKLSYELLSPFLHPLHAHRLNTMTLDIGNTTIPLAKHINREDTTFADISSLELLTTFVNNAVKLKHLHISSWLILIKNSYGDMWNIFKSMIHNKNLVENLETLTLYWLERNALAEREPVLPDPNETMTIIDHFKKLQCIGLRTPMIKRELIEMLASTSRRKLKTLKLLIHYIDPELNPNFRVPVIPPHLWKALVNREPEFRIEVAIFLKTPESELTNILTPEMPVSVVRYMKNSQIDMFTLSKLWNLYAPTLTVFHSFCDSYGLDKPLLHLVHECKHLSEIIYYGTIYRSTVTALAKTRGRNWKVFEMKLVKTNFPRPD